MSVIALRLFVTGDSSSATRAVSNLRRLEEVGFPGEGEIEVIDVLRNPELAEEFKIIATPTLIRIRPEPEKRIIGDLGDEELVLRALDLASENHEESP